MDESRSQDHGAVIQDGVLLIRAKRKWCQGEPDFCPAGYPVHLIHRSNNRRAIFACDADLAAHANWLAQGADQFGVKVHGWVFMTNHVHILATKKRQLAWRTLINVGLDSEVIAKVRDCANTKFVLGLESFRQQVHKLRN